MVCDLHFEPCWYVQAGLQQQQSADWQTFQTAARQPLQQLPGHLVDQRAGHFAQQPLAPGQIAQQPVTSGQGLGFRDSHDSQQLPAPDPAWTQSLGFSTMPQETRQDNSTAAYQALLSEEAQRMLRHASEDGHDFHAMSLLRTPQHMVALAEACKTLQGLHSLDLSYNALTDSALGHVQDLCAAGLQLTHLDLSHNKLSSQAAAAVCSVISHVRPPRQPAMSHGLSQRLSGNLLSHRSSTTAAQDSPLSSSPLGSSSVATEAAEANQGASTSAAGQQLGPAAVRQQSGAQAGANTSSISGSKLATVVMHMLHVLLMPNVRNQLSVCLVQVC